jgi:hypothetical protein
MKAIKALAIVTALLASGVSLAIAQNGPATGGQPPVAGGAGGGGAYYGHVYRYGYGYGFTGTCMPTRLTTVTGIGITKHIAAEADYLTTSQRLPAVWSGHAGTPVEVHPPAGQLVNARLRY